MRVALCSVILAMAACGFSGSPGVGDPTGDAGGDDAAVPIDGALVDAAVIDSAPDAPPAGPIELVGVVTGGAVDGVALTIPVSSELGATHVIAVATKRYRDVLAVTGLGATWVEIADQCGARDQTGVAVFVGRGASAATGNVVITLAVSTASAQVSSAIVASYRNVGSIGGKVSYNTATGLTCDDTRADNVYDNVAYSVPFSAGAASTVFAAVATRNRMHTPGAGYTARGSKATGSGGDVAGVAIVDGSGSPIAGTFSGATDIAVVAVELRQ